MPSKPDFPLYVFYDGSCAVCASEIEHYQRLDRENRLILENIALPGFIAAAHGISREDFLYQLHVIDNGGRVYRGVEAFWAIWQAFPSSTLYGLLGTAIMLPLVNPLARLCYRCFARIRGYLPKRQDVCDSGSCRLGKR